MNSKTAWELFFKKKNIVYKHGTVTNSVDTTKKQMDELNYFEFWHDFLINSILFFFWMIYFFFWKFT